MRRFYIGVTAGAIWFRWNGAGWILYDHRIQPPVFSEREGYTRCWHLGPYGVQRLMRVVG
jgi:hypothetical protein